MIARNQREESSNPALGDIVTFPDGRSFTVRMFATLPENDLGLSSLCLLGDLEMLVAPSAHGPGAELLLPVETLPPAAATAKSLCEGAAAFWAPHLPAVGGAMGEVLFRLMLVRTSFAPLVVIDRGGDHVFFLRVGHIPLEDLSLMRMPRSALSDVAVPRFAAVVEPSRRPVEIPQESRPLPRPARVPR